MITRFQIGQCRIYVETDTTQKFYESLPKISENCSCTACSYFEKNVIKKDIRLFRILTSMGIDLTRQPNINADGVSSVGPTEKFERAYMGYYFAFGSLGKTQRTPQTKVDGKIESVDFFEPEDDSFIQFKIKQESEGKLIIDFYLECEKKSINP